MLRVHACAVATSSFCAPVRPITEAALITAILGGIQTPGNDVEHNTITAIVRAVDALVRADLGGHVAALETVSGVERRIGEPYAGYVERSVRSMRVRGERRSRALDLARTCTAAAALLEQVHDGTLSDLLHTTWCAVQRSLGVDDAVDELRRLGIDSEQLCWAVITRESLQHVLLVRKEANRAARMWPDRQADDLVGYGWRGLRLALRSYNPDTAWFSTYACPKIRGSIRDGVRNEHHLPKRLNTFVNKVERAKDDLSALLGRHPTQAEIAARLEIDVERVRATATYATPSSLDVGGEEHGIELTGTEDVEAAVLAHATADAVRVALGGLPTDDAVAVQLLVMEQLPMGEVKDRTGASPKQLRARRDRGLAALRDVLDAYQ